MKNPYRRLITRLAEQKCGRKGRQGFYTGKNKWILENYINFYYYEYKKKLLILVNGLGEHS